nr:hypothetical protein [Rhodanobacter sp. OK091]
MWREHGALEYIECVADDVRQAQERRGRRALSNGLCLTPRSRSHQPTGDGRPCLAVMMDPGSLPFDGKRMFFGGFKTPVAL